VPRNCRKLVARIERLYEQMKTRLLRGSPVKVERSALIFITDTTPILLLDSA